MEYAVRQRGYRRWRGLGIAVAAGILWSGCSQSPAVYHLTGPTMGTTYSVKVLPREEGEDRAAELRKVIEDVLARIDIEMSTYRPDSELSRFNNHAEMTPFPVSPELAGVFAQARKVSEASGGAFDVTVGPLVDAWGFGPEGFAVQPPSDEELAKLHERIGYQKVEIDAEANTLRKLQPDVACDLSAIAPGFAADKVLDAITALGYTNLMVDVGGEIRAEGRNDRGQPWQIAIEKPLTNERAIERIVSLDGISLATSGDYRNYFEQDGVRMSHLIDPRTNKPIAHKLASASVLHKECALADGYATAMMVLGPEEGYEVAVRENLAVFFIIRDDAGGFVEKATPEFERLTGKNTPAS
ncbi:MAG: FAD:protein FMN transferase [Candidatus Hydrogenedentes bacterium]|nr:FAD:protein FMN transferase [Candidatus Hydrogenedentota bacterium]